MQIICVPGLRWSADSPGQTKDYLKIQFLPKSDKSDENLLLSGGEVTHQSAGRCKATWKREFKLPWREAGPPNHHDDKMDSDQ